MTKEIIEREYYQSALQPCVRVYFYPHNLADGHISHASCVMTESDPNAVRKPENDTKIFDVWGPTFSGEKKNDTTSCIQAETEHPLDDLVAREIIEETLKFFGINASQLSIVDYFKEKVIPAGHYEPVNYSYHSSRIQKVIDTLKV